jgi:hypothetical protein
MFLGFTHSPQQPVKNLVLAAFASVFLLMLALNHYEILWIDDYCRTATGSLTDIVTTTWHEYFIWTGRFFVTLVTRVLFDSRPPDRLSYDFFDIANSLVFCAYLYVIFVFATGRRPSQLQDLAVLALIFGLGVWSTDAPSLAIFWKTGAINYLWATTGEIYVLSKFLKPFDATEDVTSSLPAKILFVAFSFVIASFSENISVSVTAILPLLLFALWKKRRQVPAQLWWAAAAHLLGGVFLLVAPGNFARMAVHQPKPFMTRLGGDLSHLASTIGLHGWLIMIVLCVFLYRRRPPDAQPGRPELIRIAAAAAVSFLSFCAMSLSPAAYGGRTAFATESFMICALVAAFCVRRVSLIRDSVISLVCLGLSLSVLVIKLGESIQLSAQRDQREAEIARIKASGGSAVALQPFSIKGVGFDRSRVRRWDMIQVGDINADWSNKCFADTYQLQSSSRVDVPKTPAP